MFKNTFRELARVSRSGLTKKLLMGMTIAAACTIPVAANADTPIAQCGTVIKTPGTYQTTQALQSTSATVDCIQIAAPGVEISFNGDLTGPGSDNATGAGIRILSSASGVKLNLGNINIQGFGVGIAVEGSGAAITTGGVPGFFNVKNNAAQGVLVSGASAILIDGLFSRFNGASGLELSNASGVTLTGVPALSSNGKYGLWLHSSSGNQFYDLQVVGNMAGGIYVGEPSTIKPPSKQSDAHDNGSTSALAKKRKGAVNTSQKNVFFGTQAEFNGGPGVFMGSGDSSNLVTAITGTQNQGGDAVDMNGDCTDNRWVNNQFNQVAPSCIQ